ncbi:MAG: hypothetical protein WDN48_04670 [Pseudolabrys sp.]
MENFVFLAVLLAAFCHAAWNALIKVGIDPLSSTTLISMGSGTVALISLPFRRLAGRGSVALGHRLGIRPTSFISPR